MFGWMSLKHEVWEGQEISTHAWNHETSKTFSWGTPWGETALKVRMLMGEWCTEMRSKKLGLKKCAHNGVVNIKRRRGEILEPRNQKMNRISRIYWKSVLTTLDRLCGLVIRVPSYRFRGPGFNSRRYQIFWDVVGLAGATPSLVWIFVELLEWKSSGSGLENRN
jgi:hypothetical protein